MRWSLRKKKEDIFLYRLCFILMYSVMNKLLEYTCFYISKDITSYIFCLFLKLSKVFRGLYHIKTFPLICGANQWTGSYMITASVLKGLNSQICSIILSSNKTEQIINTLFLCLFLFCWSDDLVKVISKKDETLFYVVPA